MTRTQFERNINDVSAKLYGFALKLTKDENDANDLLQETVYKAFKNKEKFKEGSNFKSWISTIMYNTFVNHYRKKRRRGLSSAPVEGVAYSYASTATIGAHSQMNEQRIIDAIGKLKTKFRFVFLYYVEGYKYKEIANMCDMPIGTVKSRINTARKFLQSELNELRTA